MLTDGEPTIGEGTYSRASLFTWLVAKAFQSFGDSLTSARIPSLVSAVALVGLSAVWVTRKAGLLAGAAAALLLVMIPSTLELAVFVRFYTLHALVVMGMAIVAYEAVAPNRSNISRAPWALAGLALAALGWHLQPTTLVAFGALVLGCAAIVAMDQWPLVVAIIRRYPLRLLALAVVLLGGALVAVKVTGLDALGAAPLWAAWAADKPSYYLTQIAKGMPLAWPLFPIAIAVGWFGSQRRFVLFCAVVAVSALAVHSIAPAKSIRYVYYVFPFVAAVWGCALVEIYNAARRNRARAPELAGLAALGFTALAFLISVEGQRTAREVAGKATVVEALSYAVEADWTPTVPALKPLLPATSRIVTSNAMKSLYYLGRYDYELNASIVPETDSGEEFGVDSRTGGQAIATPRSVQQVLDMTGATLVVLEEEKLDLPSGVPSESLAIIQQRCEAIELPANVGVRAWNCARS
jgi:4-amino-4-deoxy-L-arabinose transferase-like glycosyltransferase